MTRILARLVGRVPVGWLQLMRNPARLVAALAGVMFANVLVFMQLGILGSLNKTIVNGYELFEAQIMISAEDANTLTEGGNVARQWLFQALADRDVVSGAGIYLGTATYKRTEGDVSFQVVAIDPDRKDFLGPELARKAASLYLPNVAIVDRETRGLSSDLMAGVRPLSPVQIEISGETITLSDTFAVGASFSADGYLITSDQTFLRLFPNRTAGAPNHIILKVRQGVDPETVVTRLQANLSDQTLRIRTVEEAAVADQTYQTTERPTGLIFGFGVLIGILVGIVIVYQVLSTDVADHLSEYATFKAIGYRESFFLGVVFEEAIILALFGFVPGLLLSWMLSIALNAATGLPVQIETTTALAVLFGTIASCTVSGAIATRRLNKADPADLF